MQPWNSALPPCTVAPRTEPLPAMARSTLTLPGLPPLLTSGKNALAVEAIEVAVHHASDLSAGQASFAAGLRSVAHFYSSAHGFVVAGEAAATRRWNRARAAGAAPTRTDGRVREQTGFARGDFPELEQVIELRRRCFANVARAGQEEAADRDHDEADDRHGDQPLHRRGTLLRFLCMGAGRFFGRGRVLVLTLQMNSRNCGHSRSGRRSAVSMLKVTSSPAKPPTLSRSMSSARTERAVVHLVPGDHPSLLRIRRELIDQAHETASRRRRWRERILRCQRNHGNLDIRGRGHRIDDVDVDAEAGIWRRRHGVGLSHERQKGVAHGFRRVEAIVRIGREAVE